MDIVSARGTLINRTLRRVLGLPSIAGGTAPGRAPTPSSPFDPAALVHVVDAIDTGVLVFDGRARLTYANTAAERALAGGLRAGAIAGVDDVFTGEHRSLAGDVREVIATGLGRRPVLMAPPGAREAPPPPLVSILPLPGEDGTLGGAFVLLDVTSKSSRRGGG